MCSQEETNTTDTEQPRTPAGTCNFCQRRLDEVGGRRITASHFQGVKLSAKREGGGNPKLHVKSVKLHDDQGIYVVVWGDEDLWTDAAISRARETYRNGQQPWMCQVCGVRACSECGAPINYPMGCEILYDDGRSGHAGVFPFDPGCINSACKKYRRWSGP